jgi:Flp pilus assembly protein TadB
MWATGASRFFSGFDRLNPRSWGRKGCFFALLILLLAIALLVALALLFNIAGVALFALIVLVVSWRPINKVARENRRRQDEISQEIRSAAAASDTEFRLGGSGSGLGKGGGDDRIRTDE